MLASFIKILIKFSSIFSAVIGPMLVMLTNIKIGNFSGFFNESQVFAISSSIWAGFLQSLLLVLQWCRQNYKQEINVYINRKGTSFAETTDMKIFSINDDAIQLNFKFEFTGRPGLLVKKKLDIVFPNQVQVQSGKTPDNALYSIHDNIVSIDVNGVLKGRKKSVKCYSQIIKISVVKNQQVVDNDICIETNGIGFIALNEKNKARLV